MVIVNVSNPDVKPIIIICIVLPSLLLLHEIANIIVYGFLDYFGCKNFRTFWKSWASVQKGFVNCADLYVLIQFLYGSV